MLAGGAPLPAEPGAAAAGAPAVPERGWAQRPERASLGPGPGPGPAGPGAGAARCGGVRAAEGRGGLSDR